VDTNHLEAMMEDNVEGAPGVAQLSGTEVGSGVLTFPLETTPYVFLFGQPHPDNPNPSEFEAGEGPFGPDPTAGGGPLFDLTEACGDRTQDCVLLTPEDLLAYDRNTDGLGEVEGFGQQARLCVYRPQFVTVNPDDRAAGLCGVFGSVVNSFFPTTETGGFDVPGVSSTWVHTQPGWFEATLIYPSLALLPGLAPPAGELGTIVDVADEPIADEYVVLDGLDGACLDDGTYEFDESRANVSARVARGTVEDASVETDSGWYPLERHLTLSIDEDGTVTASAEAVVAPPGTPDDGGSTPQPTPEPVDSVTRGRPG
jgi:hypothetical protein